MNIPLVSFVVLSWNTLDDTKICIENLKKLNYQNIEIIVVDNGSNDGSKKLLKSLAGIKYIDLPKNTGFTGGQIKALKYCKGDFIVLVNSDAILEKSWTQACLGIFNNDKKVAAVGGKVFQWNDKDKVFDTTSPFYAYQKIDLNLGYAETKRAGESIVEIDSISGAAVMIRRSVIDKVGYFDNRFFAYFEETDLFARFQRAGYKIVYQPAAQAWHQIAKSTKSKPYFYLYQMHRNRFLFGFKNFDDGYSFAKRYFIDGINAHKRYIKHKELDDKARIESFWWNLIHMIPTIYLRSKTQKLGNTYNNIILNHHEGNDITVVIPSYNYAKYLPEAIESAINQSLKPWKIIVIDDGSTDDSVNIAKKYKNVEIITKENEGVILTKNLGISLSTTTWTIFLDADDVLKKNYLLSTYTKAAMDNASIVYTDMKFTGCKSGTYKSQPYTIKSLLEYNFIHNSALISTTLLKNSGGYKTKMSKGYEDWELYLTLYEFGGVFSYDDNTHLEYRQHEGMIGRNNEASNITSTLYANVRELHLNTYSKISEADHKIIKDSIRDSKIYNKIIKQTKKRPFLIVIYIVAVPYSIIWSFGRCIYGILNIYTKNVEITYENGIRTYIHKRDKYLDKKTK